MFYRRTISPERNFTMSAQATGAILYKWVRNFKITSTSLRGQWVNSLWPIDAIWRQGSRSTLVQVMACCLTAPSHYMVAWWYQAITWTIVDLLSVMFYRRTISPERNFTMSAQATGAILYKWVRNFKITSTSLRGQWVNSLWPIDAIWRQGSRSTLVQVMAWCLTAPSHYLNQSWLIISKVPWHSSEGIIMRRSEDTGNGLVPSGNKPLPEPMLTQISVAIWPHQATMN